MKYPEHFLLQTMASIGCKKDWTVSEIEEANDICVYKIPHFEFPVKQSKTNKGVHYFEARLSDGKMLMAMRMVLFDVGVRTTASKEG